MLDMPHLAERAIGQWVARAERIHMQRALLDSEAQFRLLAENASDMITRLSTTGQMLYVSPACQSILGYSPEELTGTSSFDIIHEEDRQNDKGTYLQENYSTRHATRPSPIAHCTKTEITSGWKRRDHAILDLQSGSVIEVHSASRDITERKKAEKALQDAHENLQEAYQRTIEGWVRALDLRDRETEGHTQRVTRINH